MNEITNSGCSLSAPPLTNFMSQTPRPRRGVPQAGPQEYAAVPQSPRANINAQSGSYYNQPRSPTRTPSGSSNQHHQMQAGRGAIAMGVASGAIGGGYGPYSVRPAILFYDSNRSFSCSITQNNPEIMVFILLLALVLPIQTSHSWEESKRCQWAIH